MLVATHGIQLPIDCIYWPGARKIAAGNDAIAVVTADHRVRQITKKPEVRLREQYWTRVTDVALSSCIEGMCVGLIEDGTCMLSKRALRWWLDALYRGMRLDREFDLVNNAVKAWTQVVQIAVSDAIFALRSDGTVCCCELTPAHERPQYRQVRFWRDVRRLVVGNQCSVAGITGDGRILLDGANLERKQDRVLEISGRFAVRDILLGGSECERMLFLDTEGHIRDLKGSIVFPGVYTDALSHWDYTLLARDESRRLHVLDGGCFQMATEAECAAWGPVSSYAIMGQGTGKGAVVALRDDGAAR